jgi:hypothetical protein
VPAQPGTVSRCAEPSMLYFYSMSGRSSKSLTMVFTIYGLVVWMPA